METFSTLLALCAGNSPVTDEFPHKGQWRGALMFSLICTWINCWVDNHEAGDLGFHHIHYDIIVKPYYGATNGMFQGSPINFDANESILIVNQSFFTLLFLWVNTLHTKCSRRNMKNISAFSTISQHWDCRGSWIPSLCKTNTHLIEAVNTMAADALVTQGARTSAAMVPV